MQRRIARCLVVLATVALVAPAACEKQPAIQPAPARLSIKVAAAASVSRAIAEIGREYEAAHPGTEVAVVVGSSGNLAGQILQDAPYDLFLSADTASPQRVADAGKSAGPVRRYASGRLIVWINRRIGSIASEGPCTLADSKVIHIAIANPAVAPYGKAAVDAMKAAGIWEAVETKVVMGDNVDKAAGYAASGAADAAILPRSIVLDGALKDSGDVEALDPSLYSAIDHGAIVVKGSAAVAEAARLLDFILSDAGQAILQRNGFEKPRPEKK